MAEISRQLRHTAIMILLAVAAGSVSGQEVTEQAVFCRTSGRIEADSSDMRIAEWRDCIVCDFLKSLGESPADVMNTDYCDTYSSLTMEDSTRISIDCVTFSVSGNKQIGRLADIPEKGYADMDIPSEAPEKCIAFRRDSKLVIVWCNLFADSDKVYKTAQSFLKRDNYGYYE